MKIAYNYFSDEAKDEIKAMLSEYCAQFPSQNRAANSLNNVSPSTVSSILSGKYANISDEMWRNIREQVRGEKKSGFVFVNTAAVRDITFCLTETHSNADFTWIIAPAGSGKTMSGTRYAREHQNVFYVLCDEDMKKSDFAQALAKAAGLRVNTQKKARDIIMKVIDYLQELENPMIIFDEGDKLNDKIIHYFITIYNRLHHQTAIVFLSTSYMIKRMESGLRHNKPGFAELWSRMGRRFYETEENTGYDVAAFCIANGLPEQAHIDIVLTDAAVADFDFRRVTKKISALKKKLQIA